MLNLSPRVITIAVVTLLSITVLTTYLYVDAKRDLKVAQTAVATVEKNKKILVFTKNFIEKVLKADKEVDFDTRLKLENDVRDLNDQEILTAWQKFTASQTEAEAQSAVKNLLGLLVSRL